jgi:hypothetical protein
MRYGPHSLASKRVTIETNGFVVAPYFFLRKMPHKSKLTKDISSKGNTSTFGGRCGLLSTPTRTNPVTADLVRVGCRRKLRNDTPKFETSQKREGGRREVQGIRN